MANEWNAEEVKKVIDVASEKIPELLNSLSDVLYGKDAAAKYAQAIASFYKTLRDSGMTDEQAFALTEQYMSSLNIGGIFAKAGPWGRHKDEEKD